MASDCGSGPQQVGGRRVSGLAAPDRLRCFVMRSALDACLAVVMLPHALRPRVPLSPFPRVHERSVPLPARPPRQPAQVLGHLIRQLAGRAEHQGLTAEKARVQRVQQAQPERRRLPGAGLGLGDHIPPLQDQRQALRLDRRHLGKAQRRQRRQGRRGKGEGSEIGIGHGWACYMKEAAV